MRAFGGNKWQFLFEDLSGQLGENAFETLRHGNVFRYKVRKITCGDTVEIEMLPIYRDYRAEAKRAAKMTPTREAQENVNKRNARKQAIRLVNTNFVKDDFHITLTYHDGAPLPDEMQAQKHMQNYIRRVRHWLNKNGYKDKRGRADLKYFYVIEFMDKDGRKKRIHHHVIMKCAAPREVLKALWTHGDRVNVDELVPEKGSLKGLALYITRQPSKTKITKRWQASRNLKPYTAMTENKHKISRRQAELLAADVKQYAPQIFGKAYPDLVLDGDPEVRTSKFVAGAYIYATLYKAEAEKRRGGRVWHLNRKKGGYIGLLQTFGSDFTQYQ